MKYLVNSVLAGMLGQGAGADVVPAPASVEVQSVWDFILKGGPMMIPLAICSLVALAVIVERLMSLRRNRVIPPGFMDGLKAEMNNGSEDHARAVDFCRRNGSPIANILAAGIRKLAKPLEVVEKHIQDAGEREMVRLRKYLRLLSVVAAIAPLMGLLGTIFGMIRAFQTVAIAPEAMGKTALMAKGIYEAMITTAAGLLLAIPVLVCYHWISAKIDRLVFDMDQLTVEFIEDHAPEPATFNQDSRRLEIADASEPAVEVAAAAS
ncbi:MAG: MotA/TolQ/ExbB proton channel family protein [Planctomycetota bacterium]|nr:MotA/TolQ/ExbB proton channel family protein [Planctomycetota bacterium]